MKTEGKVVEFPGRPEVFNLVFTRKPDGRWNVASRDLDKYHPRYEDLLRIMKAVSSGELAKRQVGMYGGGDDGGDETTVGPGFWKGLRVGLPISALIWAFLVWGLYEWWRAWF